VTLDSTVIHLSPGDSRSIVVQVQTDPKLPSRVQDILDVAAELDSGQSAHGTTLVEVVPRITGNEDQFLEFPLQTLVRFAGGQGKYGAQIEVGGAGNLSEGGDGTLDLLVRTPDIQSKSVLGQRDEYHVGYTTRQYQVFVGDKNFSLSPLTEFNRYAFGASGSAALNDFTAGAFINTMRFGVPDQHEWAGYVTYQASEKAQIGINYLGKKDQNESNVVSVRTLFRPFTKNDVDIEYGFGGNGHGTDQAFAARWSGRESWISYDAQYLHAGPDYTGYYRDVDFKNINVNLIPAQDFRIEAYYRDEDRNLKRDTAQLLAPHNRYILVGGGYSSLISVYYRLNDQDDLLPVPNFNRGDRTWQLRLSQSLLGVMLVGNADIGTSRDDHLGKSSPYQRFGVFAGFQPFAGHSYGITAEYSKENDLSTQEPQRLLSGSVSGTVLIGEGTQVSAALFGTRTRGVFNQDYSLFDAGIEHRFASGQIIAMRGRQSIFAPSNEGKEYSYLAEFSMPINVPLARKKDNGKLTGRVLDAERGAGIQGVLVYAGGATALTDRNGEYHFISLKPDKYFVQLDMASIGLNRVAMQQLPHEVTVAGGQDARYDMSLTRAIGVSGVVLLFGMKDQAPGDTSQPQLFEQGGQPNVILELSNLEESSRRVSDNRGRFSFAGIRPGKWTLRILESDLPQNTYFEKDSFVIEAAPGSSLEYTFKALPRKRRIQILQQGKTLEAPPLKKKPETTPSKTEKR
jgi:hypothetical protein